MTPAATPPDDELGRPAGGWRRALHRVIFEADTSAGRRFDVVLIVLILASVATVILDSTYEWDPRWRGRLRALEWTFTILFSIEYLLRACSRCFQPALEIRVFLLEPVHSFGIYPRAARSGIECLHSRFSLLRAAAERRQLLTKMADQLLKLLEGFDVRTFAV